MYKYMMALTASLLSFQALALSMDSGDNKAIYFDDSGKRLDAIEAFKEAMADKKILQCNYIEAVGNQRTGKVTLKKKK